MKPKIISCLVLILAFFVSTTANAQEELTANEELTTNTEINLPNLLHQPTYTFYNLLKNGSFESWSGTFADEWVSNGAISKKSSTTRYLGSYSASIENQATLSHAYSDITHLLDKKVIFGCWVLSALANQTRISIDDGQTQSFSSYHSGSDDVWEFLTVTKKISPSATQLTLTIHNELNEPANIDGACLYQATTKEIVFTPHSFDDLKMPANLIYTDLINQRIGIKTNQPQEELHVEGNIKATGNIFKGDNEVLIQSSADTLYVNQVGDTMAGDLSVQGNINVSGNITGSKFLGDGSELTNLPLLWTKKEGSEDIYYDKGNVGIGTTNPKGVIHIYGGDGVESLIQNSAYPSGSQLWGIQAYQGNLNFRTLNDDASAETGVGKVMSLTRTGNVGIGTTGPGAKLHVYSTDANNFVVSETSAATARAVFRAENGNVINEIAAGESGSAWVGTVSNHSLDLMTNNTNRVRITDNGNVGIGTTEPNYMLHVGTGNQGIRTEGPSSSDTGARTFSMGGFGDFGIDAYGVVNGRFVVTESGNVGIGKPDPNYKLDVNGDIRVSGNIISEGDICIGKCN